MGGRALETVDPTSGKRTAVWNVLAPAELERRLAEASAAGTRWARATFAERSAALQGIAAQLRAREKALAELMAQEMGKPLAQGRAEVEKCAAACAFYAEHAAAMLADEPALPAREGMREFVTYQPLGLVLAIMPWNFPLWQVVRHAAPTLMAGTGTRRT